jgi:hypothetical protein
MKMRIAVIVATVLTFAYIFGLASFFPHHYLTMIPGLTISDYAFNSPNDVVWSDNNFSIGWTVDMTTSPKPGDSGFVGNGSMGYLYYDFKGGGVEELEVQNNVSVDTTVYRYLTVRFSATTNDTSLSFSSAVISEDGEWVGLPWNHVALIQQVLVFDISEFFSGKIVAIRFRITNDFNRSYDGGTQGVFMSFVSISGAPPILGTSSSNALYTELLPRGQYLEVRGASPPDDQSSSNVSVISAVYSGPINIDLSSFHYLNLTVMTDSPDIMARVVIWSEDGIAHTVLLTNYDEKTWHQVIIDLTPFGISGNSLGKIDLGYQITVGPEAKTYSVYYGQISLEKVV